MVLNHLELENWKCYSSKKHFNFSEHELINQKNGTGKSSLFEAVFFAITGKTPAGFNMNTVRYDDSKSCRVYLEFEHNGDQISIERIFGGSNPSISLVVNGEQKAENVRVIDKWFENMFNSKILSILWTGNLVSSDTLSAKFFAEAILEDILRQPNAIIAHYTGEIYRANRKISDYEAKNNEILDLKSITLELESIQSKLKNQNSVQEKDVARARVAQEAAEKLVKLQHAPDLVKGIDIQKFKRLYGSLEKLKLELKKEMSKRNSIYSDFDANELKKILEAGIKSGKCVICGGEMNEEYKKSVEDELALAGRSEVTISRIQEDIKIAESCSMENVKLYEEWQEAKRYVDSCPNYSEIIGQWDANNALLWKKFNDLQKLKSNAEKQQDELKQVEILRAQVLDWKEKADVVKEWVKEATQSYTQKLMAKASQYLHSINSRYKQIAIYGNEFVVVVENEDFALNMLPVVRLSNGEKTMCALSLVFAIANIFVPDMPLLFDETFSALDSENREQVQKFLSKQKCQIFVITHDQTWQEF